MGTCPGLGSGCGSVSSPAGMAGLAVRAGWRGSESDKSCFIPFLGLPQQVNTVWAAENISSLFSPSPEAGSPQSERGQSRGFSRGRGEDASCSSGHFLAGVRVTLVSASILTSLWAPPQSACVHISLFL